MRRLRPRARWRTPLRRSTPGVCTAPAAAVDVAADRLAVETERLHAAVEELGVPSDDVPRHGTDRDGTLDLVEERRHGGGVGTVDAVLRLPGTQDAIGRPEARARVHDGGAADALPERQGDRRTAERHSGAAAAVQALEALHRRSVEIVLREVRAFLEDDDAKPRARQLVRH